MLLPAAHPHHRRHGGPVTAAKPSAAPCLPPTPPPAPPSRNVTAPSATRASGSAATPPSTNVWYATADVSNPPPPQRSLRLLAQATPARGQPPQPVPPRLLRRHGRAVTRRHVLDRPHLVRVHRFTIFDAGPDVAYSASAIDSATLAIDAAMRIGAMRVDSVL